MVVVVVVVMMMKMEFKDLRLEHHLLLVLVDRRSTGSNCHGAIA